jgi:hemerythrin-like domain-containing protein
VEATKLLMEEHRIIEHLLESMEKAASRLETGEAVRVGFFVDAAEVIKGFADGCHHRKEEGILFPAMEAAGVPREGGPIGAMLAEHEQGRRLTRAMLAAAQQLIQGDESASTSVIQNARGYVDLLKQHIEKEDRVLFPMADRVLKGARADELAEAFERVEREETGEGVHEMYHGKVESLEREVEGH